MPSDTPSRLSDDRRYTALVSANSPEEALDIASEALGPDQPLLDSRVEDVSDREGPHSYQVTLWYGLGKRRGEPVGG